MSTGWSSPPASTDGPVLVVVLVTVMAVEMALGFGAVLALYRARQGDLTEDAAELSG